MVGKAVDQEINLQGKTITTYITYQATSAFKNMNEGDVLAIVTDDREFIESDLGAWCRMVGHRLLDMTRETGQQRYLIEKGPKKQGDRKLSMIISNPGLEDLLSPLSFALGGALSNIDVHIYFQGPAVHVLTRDFEEHLHGFNRPFSGFARKGLSEIGHIPPREKLEQLHEMGAQFYICGGSMDHFGVKKGDLAFENVVVAEYLTFLEVMKTADIHIFLQ